MEDKSIKSNESVLDGETLEQTVRLLAERVENHRRLLGKFLVLHILMVVYLTFQSVQSVYARIKEKSKTENTVTEIIRR